MTVTADLEKSTVETAYARWAPIYDAVCGPVMVKGRRAAAEAAREAIRHSELKGNVLAANRARPWLES